MKTIFLFIFVQLLFYFPISVYGNSLKTALPPQILTVWKDRQNYLSQNDLQGAYGTLILIKELKKSHGIENLNLLSQVLLWEAMEWDRKGNTQEKQLLLAFSRDISPDYPPVYFYQARTGWTQKPFRLFENIGLTITFLKVYVKDLWYFTNGLKTIGVSFIGTVFISLFVILGIFVIRSFPVLGHQLWEWSGRKLNQGNQWGGVAIIALLPIFLGLNPFWIIFVWVSLTWFWLSRSERVLLFSIFFLLIGMIYTSSNWGALFSEGENGDLEIMVDAVRGEWVSPERIVGKNREDMDWPILFTLGSVLKREGDCQNAIQVYEKVKNKVSPPIRSMVQNNIGNCYFHLKNYSKAAKEYKKNIQEFPSLVLPYYNLSQTYREQLLFDEGKELYQKALDKDETLVSKYSSYSQLGPQFLVVDENYGQNEIWKRIFLNKNKKLGDALWSRFSGEMPKGVFFMLFSFWAVSILMISLKETGQNGEMRCQTCSNTMCTKCQHYFFDLTVCGNCWESLKIKKVKPIISMNRNGVRKGATPLFWVFSYILPGSGHLFLFKSIKGGIWVFFWSFLISLFILNQYGLFNVTDGISGLLPSGRTWIGLAGFACFYLIFYFDLKREFQK